MSKDFEKFEHCFIDDHICSEKFKRAHILSQAATMSLIHGDAKGGRKVVHFGTKKAGEFMPTPIGWKKASTHRCFCHDHDDTLFKPIENGNTIDKTNLEHLFLHSMRSFAYSYYKKKYETDSIRSTLSSLQDILSNISETLGIEEDSEKKKDIELRKSLMMASYDKVRESFLSAYNNKAYDTFKYATMEFDYMLPMASVGVLSADIIDDSRQKWTIVSMGDSTPFLLQPKIILTVLPLMGDKTIVIVAVKRDDPNAMLNLKRFDNLNGKELVLALSSLILNVNQDNTFVHPVLWNYLESKGYDKDVKLELNAKRGLDLNVDKPRLSRLNLFSPEFSVRNLGIEVS